METKSSLVIASYLRTKSIYKTAKEFNNCPQSIYSILVKNKIPSFKRKISLFEKQYIKDNFKNYVSIGKVKDLADKLDLSKITISRIAKKFNLTNMPCNRNHTKTKESKENMSNKAKARLAKYGHPRGMLGKTHSESNKLLFSINSKKMWNNPVIRKQLLKCHTLESRRNQGERMIKRMQTGANVYSRCKREWVDFGNNKKYFFRSSWESTYSKYLEFLKKQGKIKDWLFEADTFWFNNIKRGVRSYLPDFKIFNTDSSIEYHEVKGWMDKKSATKLKRMKKYYPDIKMIVIDKDAYKSIKQYERLF